MPVPLEPAFEIPTSDAPLRLDTLVIGAGQAGLAAAYYLRQRGHNFCLLEAAPTAGAAWAARYDSLRLFSPAWASGLPGRPWPGNPLHYPSRDETVTYLRDYAAHFDFPIETGQRVVRLRSAPDAAGYEVSTAAGRRYLARHVIIATGPYTTPQRPAWAAALPPTVAQLHSRDYQRPGQLPGTGPVAVVGSGNSAVQIAADLAATGRAVEMAFDEQTTATPNNNLMWTALTLSRFLRIPVHTALGSWIRRQPEGVVRHDLHELRKQPTARFVGRATGVLPGGRLQGRLAATAPLDAVVWATGFRPDFGWVELPIIGPDGAPRHERGLTAAPGVAFLGLPWLNSRGSALLNGAGTDARRVVAALDASFAHRTSAAQMPESY